MAAESDLNMKESLFKIPSFPLRQANGQKPVRDPKETNAYLVGGGIASLAAAVDLIHDAHVPA